ncbi:hypothetical protein GW17_00059417 [Ensete ventricosum]|nr:hypothetical protein GW17_00059417 [Ensete ventricosum]
MALSAANALAAGDARVSMVEKSPSSSTEAGLRKRLRKAVAEQPTDASGSTARTSVDKDKRMVELGKVPERGYTMRELCKVEDQVGAYRYFTSIMMQLKCVEGEDPLEEVKARQPYTLKTAISFERHQEERLNYEAQKTRVAPRPTAPKLSPPPTINRPPQPQKLIREDLHDGSTKSLCGRGKGIILLSVSQELVAAAKRRAKELEAEIKRMRTELESLRSQRGELEKEVGLPRSNLDGARNDRARLEGDVLSLTEAASLLEVKLKVEGQKAVATYKGSRGFESGLEKMRRVNYEFGYRVALE